MPPAYACLCLLVSGCKIEKRDTRAGRGPGRSSDREKDERERSSKSKSSSPELRTELQVRVHFDEYMSKWDEYYGEREWREGKLKPLYSEVSRVSTPSSRARIAGFYCTSVHLLAGSTDLMKKLAKRVERLGVVSSVTRLRSMFFVASSLGFYVWDLSHLHVTSELEGSSICRGQLGALEVRGCIDCIACWSRVVCRTLVPVSCILYLSLHPWYMVFGGSQFDSVSLLC